MHVFNGYLLSACGIQVGTVLNAGVTKIKALSLPSRSFQSNNMEKYGNEGQCNGTITFNADN